MNSAITRRAATALSLALTVTAFAAAAAQAATNNIFTLTQFSLPVGVASLADGGYLVVDQNSASIKRVARDGTITTVAGTGTSGLSGDGGPATSAQLAHPTAVEPTPDGGFLIADYSHRIRRVAPDGTITTVAGTTNGSGGDGGPATAAKLEYPYDVAVMPGGGFLVAERFGHRVRRVDRNGTITTVAGTGSPGAAGDGGPAVSASLSQPQALAVTADGGFLIADGGNHKIRRDAPDGTITTVAGTGTPTTVRTAPVGEGGPAVASTLRDPSGVAVTADGGFLIADAGNHRIRRVSSDGRITTLAGTTAGLSGDGGAATAAQLYNPTAVAVTADGGVLIADSYNYRVRYVDADLRAPRNGPAGGNGTNGAPGAAGPQGAPGATGAQGPAGRPFDRLALAFGTDACTARSGKRLTLRYAATTAAAIELRVLKGKRTVARMSANAVEGRNAIRLRAARKPGRYAVELTATTADGQRATDRVRLTVKR
jgi:hypothetical protein